MPQFGQLLRHQCVTAHRIGTPWRTEHSMGLGFGGGIETKEVGARYSFGSISCSSGNLVPLITVLVTNGQKSSRRGQL